MKGIDEKRIEAIQSSGFKAALVIAGGGTAALHALVSHPGASRFLLEAQVPYSPEAMLDYLGEKPDTFCSEEAAATMAGRAFERALVFSLGETDRFPILGIACTAALQTNRTRRGDDRAYLCIKSRADQVVRKVELTMDTRAGQEETVCCALIDLIAEYVSGDAI